jgi:hypothetical protein
MAGTLRWPALGPILPQNDELDPVGGHPTVPGALDRDRRYPRLPTDDTNRGSGVPGRPRYRARGPSHGKMGGMIPGSTPNGPKQPGWDYDSGNIT